MGRGRIFIYLGLIIILGLFAVFVIATRFNVLGGGGGPAVVQATPVPEIPKVNVIATTQRIPRGGQITDDVIDEFVFPEDLLVEGMYTNREEVVGLIARYDLEPGTYLTQGNLVADIEQVSSAGSLAALLIPKGMVAVSVPVNRLTSVSYGLERGDQVNVIVTMPFVDLDADYQSLLPNSTSAVIAPGPNILLTVDSPDAVEAALSAIEGAQNLTAQSATGGSIGPLGRVELDPVLDQPFYIVPSEPQRPRMVSQTFIQGAIVLQLGTFPLPGEEEFAQLVAEQQAAQAEQQQQDGQPQPADQQQVPEAPKPPDIITLVVTPQDAVTLNYLIYNGAQLSLAMRAAEDDSRAEIEAVTLQFLLDEYNIPVPAKLPYGTEPRIEDKLVPPVLQNDVVVDTQN
jgi:pilus assembly protein CpaB